MTSPSTPEEVVRDRRDWRLVAVGVALLGMSAALAARPRPPALEVVLFRIVDARTLAPFALVWPVMQGGNVLAIPTVTAGAAACRRFRLAAELFGGGSIAYYGAKLVKHVVQRPRPIEILPDVVLRGAGSHGLGFAAGHAAVVVTLVVVTMPWLRRSSARRACVVIAIAVCVARAYVGAHLPLDLTGRAAVALIVGGAVRLVGGRPPARRSPKPGVAEVEREERQAAE